MTLSETLKEEIESTKRQLLSLQKDDETKRDELFEYIRVLSAAVRILEERTLRDLLELWHSHNGKELPY